MVEPNNKINDAKESSPDQTWVFESVDMGICKAYSVFPVVWNNLYQSWNMAFISNTYEEYPLVIAKLCAPIVSSMYHDVDPGLYLTPRIIALWLCLTLHTHIVERGVKPTEHDWRSNILSSLWG